MDTSNIQGGKKLIAIKAIIDYQRQSKQPGQSKI
jgi:hypothetical protein